MAAIFAVLVLCGLLFSTEAIITIVKGYYPWLYRGYYPYYGYGYGYGRGLYGGYGGLGYGGFGGGFGGYGRR